MPRNGRTSSVAATAALRPYRLSHITRSFGASERPRPPGRGALQHRHAGQPRSDSGRLRRAFQVNRIGGSGAFLTGRRTPAIVDVVVNKANTHGPGLEEPRPSPSPQGLVRRLAHLHLHPSKIGVVVPLRDVLEHVVKHLPSFALRASVSRDGDADVARDAGHRRVLLCQGRGAPRVEPSWRFHLSGERFRAATLRITSFGRCDISITAGPELRRIVRRIGDGLTKGRQQPMPLLGPTQLGQDSPAPPESSTSTFPTQHDPTIADHLSACPIRSRHRVVRSRDLRCISGFAADLVHVGWARLALRVSDRERGMNSENYC